MSLQRRAPSSGFTSIELLVVLSIMVLLGGITVPMMLPALRKGSVSDAVNTIASVTEQARSLALATARPTAGATPGPEDCFGVVIFREAERYVVALTRGPTADPGRIALDPVTGEPLSRQVLPAGVAVLVGSSEASSGPVTSSLGWLFQYRTGLCVAEPGQDAQAIQVGRGDAAVSRYLAVSTPDGRYRSEVAVFPIGLTFTTEPSAEGERSERDDRDRQ
jgi:type II secretory pathway pseudopilin PulG